MLVEQVFSRSRGVWMFAVALLVGEVVCDFGVIHDAAVLLSSKLLAYRIEFMNHKKNSTIEYDTENLPNIERIVEKIEYENTKQFTSLETLPILEALYHPSSLIHHVIPLVKETVREPFLTNLERFVRLQTFSSKLKLIESQGWLEEFHSGKEPLKTKLSKLISHLGKLPVFDKFDREADLPKTATVVSWLEVTFLLSKMKEGLKKFVPTRTKVNENAVVLYFMQFENGQIDTSIVHAVFSLFEVSRLYRLAVSEVHTVYVEDYPGALLYTGFLQQTLRKLNRFVNWLDTIRCSGSLPEASTTVNIQEVVEHFKRLKFYDYLQSSVVYDLKQILDSKIDHRTFLPQSEFFSEIIHPPETINMFLKVFAEFQAMSHFFKTYEMMIEALAEKHDSMNDGVEGGEGSKMRSEVKFLVALTDEKFEKLNQILESTDVKQICQGQGDDPPEPQTLNDVQVMQNLLYRLCNLRPHTAEVPPDSTEVLPDSADVAPYERPNSFFAKFIDLFPRFRRTINGGLLLYPTCIEKEKNLFKWKSWLQEGLADLHSNIDLLGMHAKTLNEHHIFKIKGEEMSEELTRR